MYIVHKKYIVQLTQYTTKHINSTYAFYVYRDTFSIYAIQDRTHMQYKCMLFGHSSHTIVTRYMYIPSAMHLQTSYNTNAVHKVQGQKTSSTQAITEYMLCTHSILSSYSVCTYTEHDTEHYMYSARITRI